MIAHPHLTGLILAGGRARRLGGRNKALLPLGGDPAGTPLSRILDVFRGRFARCVLVGRAGETHHAPPPVDGLELVTTSDQVDNRGPLEGIRAGLSAVSTDFAFVVGCDMPSLSGDLVDFMAARTSTGRLLVPIFRGRPEPLHAIYPAGCADAIRESLEGGTRMILDYFARAPVDYLEEESFISLAGASRSFRNINSPADLDSWAGESSP